MSKGWIKIHRQITEWEWYNEPNTFRLFLHLLLKANHKPIKYRGTTIDVGQVMTGLDVLSKDTGLSVQKVRTSLERLKLTNEITIKSSNKGTIIQIVKYVDYQVVTNEITNKQQTDNKQITTNKNVKNVDNENKEKSFDFFWYTYPNKIAKSKCKSIFMKLKEDDIDKIVKTIKSYIAYKPFEDYNHPNPLTYLNQQRWNDEIKKETTTIHVSYPSN
tara:strand:+ start:338 stop:988 length:651 start_codon:yes stop_codon:yes gene_type:complete